MSLAVTAVDAGRAGHVQELYDQFAEFVRSQGLGQVSETDQARFTEALNALEQVQGPGEGPVLIVQAGNDPWVIVPPEVATSAETARSVADRMLDGMVSVRDSWTESMAAMTEMAQTAEPIAPLDMLRLQMQIGATQVMVTMVGQEVGTISQKIDGLLKAG